MACAASLHLFKVVANGHVLLLFIWLRSWQYFLQRAVFTQSRLTKLLAHCTVEIVWKHLLFLIIKTHEFSTVTHEMDQFFEQVG